MVLGAGPFGGQRRPVWSSAGADAQPSAVGSAPVDPGQPSRPGTWPGGDSAAGPPGAGRQPLPDRREDSLRRGGDPRPASDNMPIQECEVLAMVNEADGTVPEAAQAGREGANSAGPIARCCGPGSSSRRCATRIETLVIYQEAKRNHPGRILGPRSIAIGKRVRRCGSGSIDQAVGT